MASADLTACRDENVPDLPGVPGTGLDREQAGQAIGEQRTAAFSKDRCAKNWSGFYDDVKAGRAK